MIAAIKALTTIIGLVFTGLYLAGDSKIPVLAVITVAFGLIFTHIKLRQP